MDLEGVERRLAAILSADVVGYSRLIAEDEVATVRTLTVYREEIALLVRQHRGRVVDSPGDNLLAEFPSATDAARCAVGIQRAVYARNTDLPLERKLEFRIGVHLGEVMVEGDRIYGDGVNIAARLEPLADTGGVCVSGSVRDQVRSKLKVDYHDLGQQSLKNIPEPVRVYRLQFGTAPEAPPTAAPNRRGRRSALVVAVASLLVTVAAIAATWPRPLGFVLATAGLLGPPVDPPLPDLPSIAVLPFLNMSEDPAQEYFADGITEDLITDLSRSPRLFVIARSSVFTYKGQPTSIDDVARDLGVHYVVEGSVRKNEDRIRVTAQLIDATTGFHVWSERYDRELADLFTLQSQLSETIMGSVGVEIVAAELERIRRKPTDSLTAYDACMRGTRELRRSTREGFDRARTWYQQAIEFDPEFALPYALLGASYMLEYIQGWSLDPALLDRAKELSERAIELDPEQPQALNSMGGILVFRNRMAEGRVFAERAVAADPNWNVARLVLGMYQAHGGEILDAIRSANRALRLNPRPSGGELAGIASLNYVIGRKEEALGLWERARAENPDLIRARIGLASVYESRGRHAEARKEVQEILRVNPDLTAELAVGLPVLGQLLDPKRTAQLRDQLRSAGLQ